MHLSLSVHQTVSQTFRLQLLLTVPNGVTTTVFRMSENWLRENSDHQWAAKERFQRQWFALGIGQKMRTHKPPNRCLAAFDCGAGLQPRLDSGMRHQRCGCRRDRQKRCQEPVFQTAHLIAASRKTPVVSRQN